MSACSDDCGRRNDASEATRPETRSPGAKLRGYWATDAEYAKLQREAIREETSVQELVRRRALGKS